MKINIYFSPTYQTKKIVEYFSESKETIDLSKKITKDIFISKEDIVYFGVPSYGGRVPNLASERLKKIKGNDTKAVIIVSYGNRDIEDTLRELFDLVTIQGFKVVAAIKAVARHSIFENVASDRPNELDYADYDYFKDLISKRITNKETISTVPGNYPYKELKVSSLVPMTLDKCNNCHLCAINCVNEAIDFTNAKIVDKNKCIGCMRCVRICQKSAKYLDNNLKQSLYNRLAPLFATDKENKIY